MGRPATWSTVEACPRLNVRELARGGGLREGRTTTSRWTRGGAPVAEARVTAYADGLQVDHGGHSCPVAVEWEPLPYGGARPWFRCPVARCGRRCGVLYLRGSWACRTCHRLVYPSTRLQRGDRLARKVDRLLHRLGLPWGAEPLFAPKPPRMWWRTYEELVRRAREAEEDRVEAWCASVGPWLDRMEARVRG